MDRIFLFIGLLTVCCGASASNRMVNRRRKSLLDCSRIVGGQTVNITEVPWTLAIEVDGQQICGASIIAEKWAVTAQHCVNRFKAEEVQIRAGTSELEQGGTVFNVSRIIRNEKFNPLTFDYDVALLELAGTINSGPDSKAINLTDAEPAVGDAVLISGWGDLLDGHYCYADSLNSVQVLIVDRAVCAENYVDQGGISDRMFCAVEEGKGYCQGDSGGPVVFGDALVGVMSWGWGCAHLEYPGVFTSIGNSEIRQWIKTNSGV